MIKQRRNTLHDVANLSGVSYQTVSRVINDHPNVSAETRTRVQEAIDKLGYRPNKVAKSLAAKQSNTLAVLTFGMNLFGPTQMMLNIEQAAKHMGYDLIFSNVGEPSYEHIKKALDSLSGRQVDGILAISSVPGTSYEEMLSLCNDVPIVQIDPDIGLNVPSVVIDQRYGSQLITDYLIGLGHRHMAEISGPLNWFGALARHECWEETLLAAGLTPGRSVEGDWTATSGYAAARRLLATAPHFTALVVGNDQMALGAIRALSEHGLRVPEDISVVGFDDIPEAAFFQPPLTTIHQDFASLGVIGVNYLVERIHQPDARARQHRVYPTLVVRQSAAAPRK